MKIQRLILAAVIASLSVAFAQDSGKAMEREFEVDTPFIFSLYDNPNPKLNPYSDMSTNFHLSLVYGRVGYVDGLQLGALINQVNNDMVGFDAAGIFSFVDGNFAGYQSAGIFGRVEESFIGIQDNGIYSYIGSDFTGLQSTGITNQVKGSFTGIQIAGISNNAAQVEGVQIGGIANFTDEVVGAQIAGIVNNAGVVHGVQIGLVNLSDELDGIALGLVNISKAGQTLGIAWSGGANAINAGVKFAPNDYWYTILSLGRENDFDEEGTSLGFYAGVRISLMTRVYAELDLGSVSLMNDNMFDEDEDDLDDEVTNALESRASLGFRLTERVSFFAGVVHSRTGDNIDWSSGGETETGLFFGLQF